MQSASASRFSLLPRSMVKGQSSAMSHIQYHVGSGMRLKRPGWVRASSVARWWAYGTGPSSLSELAEEEEDETGRSASGSDSVSGKILVCGVVV